MHCFAEMLVRKFDGDSLREHPWRTSMNDQKLKNRGYAKLSDHRKACRQYLKSIKIYPLQKRVYLHLFMTLTQKLLKSI